MGHESYSDSLVWVEGTMLDRIKTETEKDQVPVKLPRQVVEGVTRKFSVKEGVLYNKGHRAFVPLNCRRCYRRRLMTPLGLDIEAKNARWRCCPEFITGHAWKMMCNSM